MLPPGPWGSPLASSSICGAAALLCWWLRDPHVCLVSCAFCVCAKSPSVPHEDACDLTWHPARSAQILSRFKLLDFIASPKTLFPKKATFTNSRGQGLPSLGAIPRLPRVPRSPEVAKVPGSGPPWLNPSIGGAAANAPEEPKGFGAGPQTHASSLL